MTKTDKVADVLEAETQSTIADWLSRVNAEPDIIGVPLTAAERTAHLPEMFKDSVVRLRNPLPLGTRALISSVAYDHGVSRREQGYTPAMRVEESSMLQVSIFHKLQMNVQRLDDSVVLLDVTAIADDSQLAQAMTSYIAEAEADRRQSSRESKPA